MASITCYWQCRTCGYVKYFSKMQTNMSFMCPGACGLNYTNEKTVALTTAVNLQ